MNSNVFGRRPSNQNVLSIFLVTMILMSTLGHILTFEHPYQIDDENLPFWGGTLDQYNLDTGMAWHAFVGIAASWIPTQWHKLYFLFISLTGAFMFYFPFKFLTNDRNKALLGLLLLLTASAIVVETHRTRQESVELFLCGLSLMTSLLSIQSHSRKLSILYLIVSTLAMAGLPNTHFVAAMYVPGLFLFFIYAVWKFTGSLKATALGAVGTTMLIVLSFCLSQPHIFDPEYMNGQKLRGAMGFFDPPEGWFDRVKAILSMYIEFYRDSYHSFPHPNSWLAGGTHRVIEFKTYHLVAAWGLFTFLVAMNLKQRLGRAMVVLGAALNIFCFLVLSILVFRITTYYMMMMIPWLVILALAALPPLEPHTPNWIVKSRLLRNFVFGIACTVILLLNVYNFFSYPWVLRKTNYTEIKAKIESTVDLGGCTDVTIASEQYRSIFLKYKPLLWFQIIPFYKGTALANDPRDSIKEMCRRLENHNSCLVISAWHYLGLFFYSQFPRIDRLRAVFERDFELLGTVSMPYYKNDPWFPAAPCEAPECKQTKYPAGFVNTWAGGTETIWIYKRNPQRPLDGEICNPQLP